MALDMFDLTGRVALVTGASKGLGRSMAVGLAKAGASLALCARDRAGLAETRAAVEAQGARAQVFALDVLSRESVRATVAGALAAFGRLDVLVNNAGVIARVPALELAEEDWDRVVDTNLKGYFLVAQAVGAHLVAQGRGKVINVSSVLGTVGLPNVVAYASSKGGVGAMTRVLALEWAKHGVQVNAIAPAYFSTPLTRPLQEDAERDRFIVERTPLGRWGRPEEMEGTVVYLASRASDYVTGQTLHVDGGWTAW